MLKIFKIIVFVLYPIIVILYLLFIAMGYLIARIILGKEEWQRLKK